MIIFNKRWIFFSKCDPYEKWDQFWSLARKRSISMRGSYLERGHFQSDVSIKREINFEQKVNIFAEISIRWRTGLIRFSIYPLIIRKKTVNFEQRSVSTERSILRRGQYQERKIWNWRHQEKEHLVFAAIHYIQSIFKHNLKTKKDVYLQMRCSLNIINKWSQFICKT